jgi:glycosyltransferase involved in cell wall biosynthesis
MEILYLIREKQTVSPCFHEIIEEFERQGHNVTVINEYGSFYGFKCFKAIPKNFVDYPSGAWGKIAFSKAALKTVLKNRLEPDIVFGAFPEATYCFERFKAPKVVMVQDDWGERIKITPFFATFRRVSFPSKKLKLLVLPLQTKIGVIIDDFFQKKAFKKNDGVVFVCREAMQKNFKFVKGFSTVIFNGINLTEMNANKGFVKKFKQEFGENIVVFLGRLELQKNPKAFVLSAEKVLKKQDAFFLIAGDGFLKNKIEKLVKKKGLQEKVRFLGWLDNEKKKALLEASKIFVIPSFYDPCPVSVFEAMAFGCAIVGARVGGIKDVVRKENGFTVNPKNINEISSAISILLENKNLLESMQLNSKKFVKNFSLKKTAKEYIEFFEKLLKS